MMSVLFLAPLPEPVTGHSLASQIFHAELIKHFKVEVVNLNKSEFKPGITSVQRVREVVGMLWRIWRRRNRYDTIYFTVSQSRAGNVKDLVVFLMCHRRLRTMAVHLHGGAGMMRLMSTKRSILRSLNRFFVQRLGAAIVLGPSQRKIYVGTLPDDRIHTVPNCAQDYLFADRESISRKFEHVVPLRILFLSNLLPGKGYVELVEAFRALDEPARSLLEIDFAGGFESEAHKANFLRSLEGHPQLHYHGTVRENAKKELFARAHVFCLPTYYPYEGQPMSILEAYASGCAVITTDHGGILDIFSDGVNGYCVARQSAPDLTRAIERAISAPARLRTMALANFDRATADHRAERYTSDLVGIMYKLHAHAA
jgi:glycosyltransferase involved in cell wall biosynthesis